MHASAHADASAPLSFPQSPARASRDAIRSGSGDTSAHFVTVASLFRRPLFLDPDAARAVARCQPDPAIWGRAGCLAWVLMPDRWHGLVLAPADESLDALVRRFKAITARAVEDRFRVNGWLWSRGYNQRVLERHEDRLAVARHLVSNPVRAGLAKSVGAWPYWDAIWLGGQPRAPS
jgi:REP element-mobilizing transposase RayT